MASTIIGDPAGEGLTSPVPAPDASPASAIPSDGDPANVASVMQYFETGLDWAAYVQRGRQVGDAAGGLATSFDGTPHPTTWNDLLGNVGAPISGLDVLPTFAAGSGFVVNTGAGSGFLFTAVGIGAGESTYRKIYWNSFNTTISAPHATLDRIDAITVAPGAFGSTSTVALVTGTAASVPLPPSIPAGAGVIFYVLVPHAAADATSFRACRGLWRRSSYPSAGRSGIVSGCQLTWDYTTDPAISGADMWFGPADVGFSTYSINRLLVDGELLEWSAKALTPEAIVSDSGADPFSGGGAPSNHDLPYYIYAVGGRHNPMPSRGPSNAFLCPVTIVESLVPPDVQTGHPTAVMTVNGVSVLGGAVYVGLGFVAQGTNHRRACVMDSEMTYSLNPLQIISHAFTTAGHEDIGTFAAGAQPAISTKMLANIIYTNQQGIAGSAVLLLMDFPLTTSVPSVFSAGVRIGDAPATGHASANMVPISFTARTGSELYAIAGGSGDNLQVGAMAFNHRVKRLDGGF